jgi:hypothetical protein
VFGMGRGVGSNITREKIKDYIRKRKQDSMQPPSDRHGKSEKNKIRNKVI